MLKRRQGGGGGGGNGGTISSSASLWKINERAERVNGKQTWAVIKALVVTCEQGEAGGMRGCSVGPAT